MKCSARRGKSTQTHKIYVPEKEKQLIIDDRLGDEVMYYLSILHTLVHTHNHQSYCVAQLEVAGSMPAIATAIRWVRMQNHSFT